MTKFVMNRDLTLNSVHGHAVEFLKDQPTHVPPALVKEVVAAGGLPEDGKQVVIEDPGKKDKGPEDAEERKLMIFTAFEDIIKRNDRNDFTAGGAPHAKAVSKLLGFEVIAAERDQAWADFQAESSK